MSYSVFQSVSHSLSPDAAVFIPRQFPVDGPLQVQQIPSYMTNCYPFVQLDAERYNYFKPSFIHGWDIFARFKRALSSQMFLAMNRCSWCIILMIIYILIARISRQTNFTPLNCEIKFLEEKLVYSTCI